MNLLVYTSKDRTELQELKILKTKFNLLIAETLETLEEYAANSDILLLCKFGSNRDALKRVLAINPNIRWVHSLWTGVDSLIYPELKDFPLVLTNAKGMYAEPLAEFAILACLFFSKDVPRLLRNKRLANWEPFGNQLIAGKTLGIFGYGEIGKAVAKRANALGMNVIATRKNDSLSQGDPLLNKIIPLDQVDTLFEEADFLVCAAPLTADTNGFVNLEKLALLKKTAVLINIGRGSVVNENDLIETLKSKKIRGAALDVFDKEPLSSASPLWDFENVLISPHSTDQNEGWLENSMKFFVENCKRFLNKEKLLNIVDIDKGY